MLRDSIRDSDSSASVTHSILSTFLMSFPLESLSLKLMKLVGEVGAEVFWEQGTMLCRSSGLEDEEKQPETETRADT